MSAGLRLEVHGVTAEVRGDDPQLLDAIARDFACFQVQEHGASPDVLLNLSRGRPPTPRRGLPWPARGRAWVYDRPGERSIDYHGRATALFLPSSERAWLWSENHDVAWEAAYLFLMSRVGELLNRRGVHRLHGLGLTRSGRAALLALPSGGGKSTLGLAALQRRDFGLLSDDLPLLTTDGQLLPFPNRLGFTHSPPGIAAEHLRPFRRLEHGLKWLVDVEAFPGRLATPARPQLLVIGRRLPEGGTALHPRPARAAWPTLVASVVVGVGLPQSIEHFLRPDPADLPRKAAIVASRLRACRRLLAEVEVWELTLGADRERNIETFLDLLDRRLG